MWLRIILCAIALLQVSECLVNPCKKGLKSTQFFAHPEAADKYIQCSMFGQMFVFSCPPGLVWKQEKTACDLKSFVSIFSIPSTTTAQTPSSNIDSGSAPSARIVAPPQVVPQVVPQTVPQQVQQQTFEQPPMQPQVQQQQVQQQQQPQQQKFQQPQQVQQPMKVQQQQQQFQQPQQVQQPMQVQQQAPQQPKQLQQQEFRSQQQEIQQLQQQLQKEQQQLQQQPMPTTGPSSTQFAPIATTVSSTTSTTTTTTTTPVPVPLPTANQQVVTPVGNTVVSSPAVSTPSVSGGRCDSVSVSGSVFNIVNGVYSKLPSSASIYRRSDNLQLPGLLVKTSDQQWCVTFSFSTVDFNTLTVPDVLSRCGAGLDCCMLISEPASTATAGIAEIDDPSAVWIANILENRGKQDASIKFTCETTVKACTKVPFCPPECQGTRDGCDICECNGVPFFKIQSSELSSFGGAQQPQQQQQTPVVQQQTPQIPQQIPQQVQQQQVPQQQVPQQQVPQQQVPQQQVQQQQVPQQQVQQQQVQQQQVQQQQVQQQVQQQIQQQPQMQPQPSTRPNPVVAPSTMQPTTQPQRPVTKVVQPATMQPQIIQEEQFRPTFIQNPHQEQQQQQQLQLQQQELQTLNELDKTVHQAQSPAAQANSVSQFANRVEAIEKQQLQNQVDQLNRLIASAKTPSQPVTRPMFPGQQPVDVNAQQSQKIVQSFPQPQPQQPLTDMNHFVNTIPVRQPTQQQQQQQTMQSGLTERQRQELLMQQRKQQDIIARQQQEQLVRQEQEQRMLQQQFKQLQQQKTPGITTLSSRKFAARLPQPMAHMNQVKVLALNATSNQTEIQPTQPIHFEQQQQQMPVQPVPTPVVEASVAQPAPSVQPQQVKPQHVQSQQQQQQQQHPTIQPIQPTQQLIQPFQPIQQQQPQQPQQKVHTPIKPVMTVDQTGPTTTRMNSGVFVDQQRQSPSSKQFNSPSLNKAIEFNRQNMHKTLFQPMIKSIPITKCNVVQCGKNMVCREIRDCPMCSPMCLPQDPTEINLGHVITCENIKCPVPFKCVKSTFDHSVKCEV